MWQTSWGDALRGNILSELSGHMFDDVLVQGRAVDRKLTHGTFDLVNTGVTTDKNTPLNAAIMSATVLLYLIIQVLRRSATEPVRVATRQLVAVLDSVALCWCCQ